MKIGDKVRFLNEIGGGIVTGFRGKDIVLVEDADGFDIPMPIRECVVIDTDDYNMTRPVPKATPKKVEEKPVRSSISHPVHEEKEMGHLSKPQVSAFRRSATIVFRLLYVSHGFCKTLFVLWMGESGLAHLPLGCETCLEISRFDYANLYTQWLNFLIKRFTIPFNRKL